MERNAATQQENTPAIARLVEIDKDCLGRVKAGVPSGADQRQDQTSTIPTYSDLPATGFLRDKQIYPFFGIGRSTWWKWVRAGRAPAGIKLGARTTVWRAEDIRALLDELTAQGSAA